MSTFAGASLSSAFKISTSRKWASFLPPAAVRWMPSGPRSLTFLPSMFGPKASNWPL